jgi:predicted NUDIX family phosphoesterase
MWLDRTEAEQSSAVVQIVPAALIANQLNEYLMLRRVGTARADLRKRYSIVISGHVDRAMASAKDLMTLLDDTLRAELWEEIGLLRLDILTRVGLVIDQKDDLASRHVAFITKVVAKQGVQLDALEEFSGSAYDRPAYAGLDQISSVRLQLDPWSRILLDYYLRRRR